MIMDYEKKYKNALEWARQVMSGETGFIRKEVEEVFPELKESEDEKIRKAILNYMTKMWGNSQDDVCGVHVEDAISWLEKQGEQEPKGVSIWKHWKDGIAGNGDDEPIYLIKSGNTYNLSSCLGFECDYIELSELDKLLSEKQTEQKVFVVDFKAKDWYVSKVDGKIHNAKFMEKPSTNQARRLEIEKAAVSATGIIDQEEWFIKGAKWADENPSYISSEKQGEPKILGIGVEHASGVLKECIDKIAPKSAMETIKEEKVDNQNCVKTTDKVEPKFKVGDWIIRSAEGYKHNTYLVTEIKDYYVCEELKGRRVTFTFNDVHKNFKLWDVSDAKDGDVLVDEGKPFIFRGFDRFHPNCPVAYCGIDDEDYFIVSSGDGWWTGNEKVLPATKGQCDLLFQKMKEAGYEWDTEKKELKKIRVIDEGKSEMDNCFTKMMNGEKVSPAWSEDDEKNLQGVIDEIEANKDYAEDCDILVYDRCLNWLKSLKERVK